MRIVFEEDDDEYFKQKRVSKFCHNDYVEHESNSDRNKNLLLEQYRNKTKPYLRDVISDLQESDTWMIQLTIVTNFSF